MKYDPNIKFKPPNESSFKIGDKVTVTSELYSPPFDKYSTHFIVNISCAMTSIFATHKIYRLAKTMDTPIREALWFTEQQFKLISTP